MSKGVRTASVGVLFLFIAMGITGEKPVEFEGDREEKMDGIGFVAPRERVSEEALKPVDRTHADWISVMPLGFGKKGSPDLGYDLEWQWWGERPEGVIRTIQMARENGYKVFLKPQLWLRHGYYTGDFYLSERQDRIRWEANYERFILRLAGIADSMEVEMFCVGTEMEAWVNNHPEYWKSLIRKVRQRFDGTLTYAANWDNYQKVPFWDQLDYIGINAYFPLTGSRTPSVASLVEAWKGPARAIERFRDSVDHPVFFPEFGYRSIDHTAEEPWDSSRDVPFNAKAQANGYRALFRTFWNEEWFRGGFLWKWFSYHEKAGGKGHKGYTPQNKRAEKVVRSHYEKW